nr:McmB [Thermoactinomyces sp.]
MAFYLTCSDLSTSRISEEAFQIKISTAQWTVRLDPLMEEVFTKLLPKFQLGAKRDDVLNEEEKHKLHNIEDQLKNMNILFAINEETAQKIRSVEDCQLFTYIARRKKHPEEHFLRLKSQTLFIAGDPFLTLQLSSPIKKLGWRVSEGDSLHTLTEDLENGIVMVVLPQEQAHQELLERNREYHRKGIRWLPLLFTPTQVELGPWIWPSYTACWQCPLEGSDQTILASERSGVAVEGPSFTQGFETSSLPSSSEHTPASDSHYMLGWPSLQPSYLSGVMAHFSHVWTETVLRTGEQTPWGKKVRIRCESFLQQHHKVWKNTRCSCCSPVPVRSARWAEVCE